MPCCRSKQWFKPSTGVAIIEAAIGSVILITLSLLVLCVVDCIQETTALSDFVDTALGQNYGKPLLLATTPDGDVETALNTSSIDALLEEVVQSATDLLGDPSKYFVEVSFSQVDLNPMTGEVVQIHPPTAGGIRIAGSYSPSAQTIGHTDLLERYRNLFAATKIVHLGANTIATASLYASTTGTRASATGTTRNFVDKAVVVGVRAVKKLADSFRGRLWTTVTGVPEIVAVKAVVLRGDF